MILKKILLGVLVFTIIEYIGLGEWLRGSGVHITTYGKIALFVIIYLEHFVSVLVGANLLSDRSLFSIPR